MAIASTFFHEVLHLDYFMNSDSSTHVTDKRIKVSIGTPPNDKPETRRVYAATNIKILAKLQSSRGPGYYVARNGRLAFTLE